MQEVYDFLKKCGTYFLATVDGDQARVRPFGTVVVYNGRLYIQTGKIKSVSKQMSQNPKIEISACEGQNWIRVTATAVNDDDIAAKRYMLDAYPSLQKRYKAEDENTQVLYLRDVVATFFTMGGEPRTVKF